MTVSSLSGDVHSLGREPETRGGDSLSPSSNGTGSLSRKSAYIFTEIIHKLYILMTEPDECVICNVYQIL